jgi:TRAP-type C4-dicarboxylate transport system substrate-binding protein
MVNLLNRLVLAAAFNVLAVMSAHGLELRVASGSGPAYVGYDPMYTTFMEALATESGGEVTAKHFGMEVANLSNMLTALGAGVVDVGNFQPVYFPAEFPNVTLIGELVALGTSAWIMTGATNEYIVSCADCLQEFNENGLVYLMGPATPSYQVLTVNKAVTRPEDLKGLRLRTPGASYSRWIIAMGGIPATISFNEEYEALQGGILDGTIAPLVNLIGNRLHEVINYQTALNVGAFNASANLTASLGTWEKMTADQRRALIRAAVTGGLTFGPAAEEVGARGVGQMKARGGQVLEPAPELVRAMSDFVDNTAPEVIKLGESRYSIADSKEKVKRYMALVEKWKGIVESVNGDHDAMVDALWENVWSKVNFEKYGLSSYVPPLS